MFKKSWYKFLAWTLAIFYFYIMAGVVISIFSPGPSEAQTMQYMQGYMKAMNSSLMGWSMESREALNQLLVKTSALVFPAIFGGAALGVILKLRRAKNAG